MKRRAPGEHLVHHHAQRVHIGPRVEFITPHAGSLLERHISGRAIGLAGFVNGDDVRVMNAPRGSRFILKAQQEVGVIQQLAAQDFERHRTRACRGEGCSPVGRTPFGPTKAGTHAALTQAAEEEPETARKTRSEMAVDLSHIGKSHGCSGDLRSPVRFSVGAALVAALGQPRGLPLRSFAPSRERKSVSSGYVLWH